jgi:hypothetical protein
VSTAGGSPFRRADGPHPAALAARLHTAAHPLRTPRRHPPRPATTPLWIDPPPATDQFILKPARGVRLRHLRPPRRRPDEDRRYDGMASSVDRADRGRRGSDRCRPDGWSCLPNRVMINCRSGRILHCLPVAATKVIGLPVAPPGARAAYTTVQFITTILRALNRCHDYRTTSPATTRWGDGISTDTCGYGSAISVQRVLQGFEPGLRIPVPE